MRYLAFFLIAMSAGCYGADDAPADPVIVCDAPSGPCWAFADDWGAWALHYPPDVLTELESAGEAVPLEPPPAGDRCWIVLDGLPLCAVTVDGVALFGRPLETTIQLGIELEPSDCAEPYPWTGVGSYYSRCFGVLDGVVIPLMADM